MMGKSTRPEHESRCRIEDRSERYRVLVLAAPAFCPLEDYLEFIYCHQPIKTCWNPCEFYYYFAI